MDLFPLLTRVLERYRWTSIFKFTSALNKQLGLDSNSLESHESLRNTTLLLQLPSSDDRLEFIPSPEGDIGFPLICRVRLDGRVESRYYVAVSKDYHETSDNLTGITMATEDAFLVLKAITIYPVSDALAMASQSVEFRIMGISPGRVKLASSGYPSTELLQWEAWHYRIRDFARVSTVAKQSLLGDDSLQLFHIEARLGPFMQMAEMFTTWNGGPDYER